MRRSPYVLKRTGITKWTVGAYWGNKWQWVAAGDFDLVTEAEKEIRKLNETGKR